MKTKTCTATVKAAGTEDGLEPGQFEAIVSVFNNVDSYGDVVVPGAFADTLKAWAEKGDPIPVIWSHQWSDPESHIGEVLAIEERPEGLWVKAQIDLDDDSPRAKKVNRLLKGRRVTQFSFAYDEVESGPGKRDDRDVWELRKLDIHEVGPCLIGVNRDTELLAAKAAEQENTPGPWRALVEHAAATGNIDVLRSAIEDLEGGHGADGAPAAPEPGNEPANESGPDTHEGDPTLMSPASVLVHADLLALDE